MSSPAPSPPRAAGPALPSCDHDVVRVDSEFADQAGGHAPQAVRPVP
ncbi:hypothetical protein [Streptomyces litmocidini]|nr:hypothetical protein [Streptomyces litmocidini]